MRQTAHLLSAGWASFGHKFLFSPNFKERLNLAPHVKLFFL